MQRGRGLLRSHGRHAGDCVGMCLRDHRWAILLGPWPQKAKTNWVRILERNHFEKVELGFRQNLGGLLLTEWHFKRLSTTQKQYEERG